MPISMVRVMATLNTKSEVTSFFFPFLPALTSEGLQVLHFLTLGQHT